MSSLTEYGRLDHNPRLDGYEYVKIDSILEVPFMIQDFLIYESRNKEKYSAGNTQGVHICMILVEDKRKVRISTHSKGIIRALEMSIIANVEIAKDEVHMIGRKTTAQGYQALMFI